MTRAAPDLLALLILGCALGTLLLFVATLPPTKLATSLDHPPAGLALYYFYGAEHNANGAFRWSKPQAEILVSINRPGTYRVTLALQDSPVVGPPRPVTLRLTGGGERTYQLDTTLHDYTITGRVDRASWLQGQSRSLDLQIETTPAAAPGDARQLGAIVSRVTVVPAASADPWDPALFGLYFFLLAAGYGGARLIGTPVRHAAGLAGALLGVGALLALIARPLAFQLAYLPITRPIALVGLALLAAPLPLLRPDWARPGTRQAQPAVADALDTVSDIARVRSFWSCISLPIVPLGLLALGIRLYGLNRLSLWQDEGFTVLYARLPWAKLLGLRGQYDVHPPFYYAVTKLAALVVPEASAGRLVSALAGAATVPVLYALIAHVAGRGTALAAATILALSPLHIWYSQEARMYALAILLVALSYVALVAYDRSASPWCALGYSIAVLLALYTDFSAAFALAPQLFLLALLVRWHGWRALTLWGAGAGAALAFLPWLYAAVDSVGTTANRQAWFLGVSLSKITDSIQAIGGFSGESSYYWGPALTPWARWPALHGVIVLVVALTIIAGTIALIRRRTLAPTSAVALLAGTIGTATLVSVISPGYADRTVLYAVLGWAFLIGAAPLAATRPALRALGGLGVVVIVTLSILELAAIERDALKQDYRALAQETARVAPFAPPVLTDDALTAALLDVYEPALSSVPDLTLGDTRSEAQLPSLDAFWFAYADYSSNGGEGIRQRLDALDYKRLAHIRFPRPYFADTLFLDFYARPDASVGTPVSLAGSFWRPNLAGSDLAPGVDGNLRVFPPAPGPERGMTELTIPLPVENTPRLLTLRFAVQAPGGQSPLEATSACLTSDGAILATAEPTLATPPGDGSGLHTGLAILCPDKTATLRIRFANRGLDTISVGDLGLWEAQRASR